MAGELKTITATTTLTNTEQTQKFIVANGATNITINIPAANTFVAGKLLSFSRAAGSTGTITIIPASGNIQALAGTTGPTTTIGVHSSTGGGVRIHFWANTDNIWYR